jgi:putative flippase GtrA
MREILNALQKMVNRLVTQASKFAVIGAGATLVHFTTLSLLIEVARVPWPTAASAVGSVFGVMTSYLGNYAWTFARKEPHREFVSRFVVTYLFSMAANTCVFYVQVHFLGFYYAIAFLVATTASTLINFCLCRVWVFERQMNLRSYWRVRQAITGDDSV